MMVLHNGSYDRRGSTLATRLERMTAFHHAPAMVRTLVGQFDHLPKVLSDIANPRPAGLRIEREPPWISKAVCPNFRESSRCIHERIVFWDGVVSSGIGMIYIQTHHDGLQIG